MERQIASKEEVQVDVRYRVARCHVNYLPFLRAISCLDNQWHVILELFGFDTHGQLLFIPLSSSLCDCELFHSFYDKPISITHTVSTTTRVPFCDECPIIIKFFFGIGHFLMTYYFWQYKLMMNDT